MEFWVARRNGGEIVVAVPAIGNSNYRPSILIEAILEIEKISLVAWHLSQALDRKVPESFEIKIFKDSMSIDNIHITFHLEEWEQK